MIPPSLLGDPARRAATAAMLLIGAVLAGYVYFVSLYLQKVHDFSPVQTGLALLPATLTVVLMSTLGTRRLLSAFGAWRVLLAGLAIMTAGQLWLAQIGYGSSYLTGVLPGVLLTALSIGLTLPAASAAHTGGDRDRGGGQRQADGQRGEQDAGQHASQVAGAVADLRQPQLSRGHDRQAGEQHPPRAERR